VREKRSHTPDGASINVIRFLWFNGVSTQPLWDAGRVTPQDERWLRQVVGLSDTLIGQLRAWAATRDALGSRPIPDRLSAVDEQADALVTDLNAALDLRFTVEHVH
jgi:hypothetical protein